MEKTGIIVEFKRRSPSGFKNSRYLDPVAYFREQISPLVAGFSVLSEPDYFHGNYGDATGLQDFDIPILDKDFISTNEMIDSAYNAGYDAILLIADFLRPENLESLCRYAIGKGMEVLIEFHDLVHIHDLRQMPGVLYGYNRRNLKTLQMDPHEDEIRRYLEDHDLPVVLESGIDSRYLKNNDVSKFAGLLVGTSILSEDLRLP